MKHNLNIFTPREDRKISFKQKNLYLNTQFVINPNHKYTSLTLQDNHDIHKKSQNGNKSESCDLIF